MFPVDLAKPLPKAASLRPLSENNEIINIDPPTSNNEKEEGLYSVKEAHIAEPERSEHSVSEEPLPPKRNPLTVLKLNHRQWLDFRVPSS